MFAESDFNKRPFQIGMFLMLTDMDYMFDLVNLMKLNSNWDVSNVKDMSYMFKHSEFNKHFKVECV